MSSNVCRRLRSIGATLLVIFLCCPAVPAIAGVSVNDSLHAYTVAADALRALTPSVDAAFGFRQSRKSFAHLARPWATWDVEAAGHFLLTRGLQAFYQRDSITAGTKILSSSTFFNDTSLFTVGYGEKSHAGRDVGDRTRYIATLGRYTPAFILQEFLTHRELRPLLRFSEGVVDTITYQGGEGGIVSIAIRSGDHLPLSVSTLYNHRMYGDVRRTILYEEYRTGEGFSYPARITERELGTDLSTMTVTAGGELRKDEIDAMIPPGYCLAAESPEADPIPEIAYRRYADGIHLLDMKHTDSRGMIVEFRDFLMAIEAPLTAANGELILKRAREIAPGKPVRYFTFGHHHPHYLGGLRAFVHDGATVLTLPIDTAYLHQIATFPHTLEPDSLALSGRDLKMELFENETTISDGEMEVRIIHIGTISDHADDFLIYYFPKQRMLFQGELAWIPLEGPITAAGPRQRGLYEAIMKHGLQVDTIIQSWPLGKYKVRDIIDFADLEKSMAPDAPKK